MIGSDMLAKNYLRSELNQLIGLIIQWRKLELESWRDLLNIEASKATEKSFRTMVSLMENYYISNTWR
jgi:midasin (ATPase involved in ribosome maturation)